MQSNCIERERLAAYSSGQLAGEAADDVARHVAECSSCESALETVESESASCDLMLRALNLVGRQEEFGSEPEAHAAVLRAKSLKPALEQQDTDQSVGETVPIPSQLRDYELLEKLDEGGMGSVYKARHARLHKLVALKLIRPERVRNPSALSRFNREMKAAGKVEHANIVRALDAGEAEGNHFLVMEYVEGETLAEVVRRDGPLPVAIACDLVRQAASGLQHIHDSGLVHRDIKPSNLMVVRQHSDPNDRGQVTAKNGTSDGRLLKILDLGLALLSEQEGRDLSEVTANEQVMGTYDYIAPEQAKRSHEVDARADIYSLGCTFYFFLAGHPPFQDASVVEKLVAHQLEQPKPLNEIRDDLPEDVLTVVGRMMAKSPAARFQAAEEIATALASRSDTIASPNKLQSRGLYRWSTIGILCIVVAAIPFLIQRYGNLSVAPPKQETIVAAASPEPSARPDAFAVLNTESTNRTVAKWALTAGGKVSCWSNPATFFENSNELPADPLDVHTLDLRNTSINEDELKQIADLPNLDRVFLSNSGAATSAESLVVALASSAPASLRMLHLDRVPASNEALQRLRAIDSLKAIDLTQPELPVEGLRALLKLPKLEHLRLNVSDLTDAHLTAVQGTSHLQTLSLVANSKLDDMAIDGLRNSMPNCDVSVPEGKSLQPFEPPLATVTDDRRVARWVLSMGGKVNVANDTVTKIGDVVRLPAEPFALTTIYLSSCLNTNADLYRLSGLKDLRRLFLGGSYGPTLLTNETVEILTKVDLPKLQALYLRRIPLDDNGLRNIGSLSSLFEISLDGTNITDNGLRYIADLSNLKNLDVNHTRVTGSGLVHLRDHDLRTLMMIESPLTEEGFLSMPAWPNLELLRVDGCPLTDRAIQSIARYPFLKDLGGNLLPNATKEAWSVFGSLPNLERVRLRLNHNSVDDSTLARIANLKELTYLDLEICPVTDRGLQHLAHMKQLRYLDLRGGTRVTTRGVAELRELLPECRILYNTSPINAASIPP